MEDALQEILDRQEIIDLTIAYGWLLDHGPRERLDTVFTKDAVCDYSCLLYTSPSPRDQRGSRMPSSA